MSDLVCIICHEGASPNKGLISNPEMIEHLYESCKERLSLEQTDIKSLTDRLASLSDVECKSAYYHSECRKPIVNRGMIERLRGAKRYSMEITKSGNYRKYLKQLLSERLPNLQFVKSLRKSEPDKVVLPAAVSKAIDVLSAQMDSRDTIKHLETMARMLRGEIMQQQKWAFTGSFEDFPNLPLIQFFLTHLLFGSQALNVSGMRDKEVNKMVDVACQFVVQNTKTDRQVKHQPKANEGFKQTMKTSLSVGLHLTIRSRVRNKKLVNTLSDVYIGSDYKIPP